MPAVSILGGPHSGLTCSESYGIPSCSSLNFCSFGCWMDTEQAVTPQACQKSAEGYFSSWTPMAVPEPPAAAECSAATNHCTTPAWSMPLGFNSSVQSPAKPQQYASAQNLAAFGNGRLPGSAAAAAGGIHSRKQALLELWNILAKLRGSGNNSLDDTSLPSALAASQAAIGQVHSSMRVVRAALSAADARLASRALDVATVAVEKAVTGLQAAAKLAMQELLMTPQLQQQMLHQMGRMQRIEGELDDTCCSMHCCCS